MKLTNYEILTYSQQAYELLVTPGLYIPVKANFFIQKNIQIIQRLGREIEEARLKIVQHYGSLNEETMQYVVAPERVSEAEAELYTLFSLEQDVDIKTISINDLGDINLSIQQMQMIMFMIEE